MPKKNLKSRERQKRKINLAQHRIEQNRSKNRRAQACTLESFLGHFQPKIGQLRRVITPTATVDSISQNELSKRGLSKAIPTANQLAPLFQSWAWLGLSLIVFWRRVTCSTPLASGPWPPQRHAGGGAHPRRRQRDPNKARGVYRTKQGQQGASYQPVQSPAVTSKAFVWCLNHCFYVVVKEQSS